MHGERRLLARRGNRRYGVFLAVFAGVAVTAATAVLALTVLVDPFGMIGLVEIEGFNASKPHVQQCETGQSPLHPPRKVKRSDTRQLAG